VSTRGPSLKRTLRHFEGYVDPLLQAMSVSNSKSSGEWPKREPISGVDELLRLNYTFNAYSHRLTIPANIRSFGIDDLINTIEFTTPMLA